MSKVLTVTVADDVMDEINHVLTELNAVNKSAVVEEILRVGLVSYADKKGIKELRGEKKDGE